MKPILNNIRYTVYGLIFITGVVVAFGLIGILLGMLLQWNPLLALSAISIPILLRFSWVLGKDFVDAQ